MLNNGFPNRSPGSCCKVPSPPVMLIHLAAHAALHGCARLMWLYDLRRFITSRDCTVDWAVVTELARRWRLSLPVATALERVLQEAKTDG